MSNMTILVTGACGQLGRALRAELAESPHSLILTEAPAAADGDTVKALDITDLSAVQETVRGTKCDLIINCAAYTAVDKQEEDVDLSYRINAIGPRNLAIAAEERGARLIHISTDYVFDGEGTRPYIEFDATAPKSVYGKSKLAGESMVAAHMSRYMILRTAWLYGDGHNFVKTMLRLSETHESVSVVEDQLGTPTSAVQLAKAVCAQAATDNYGIFHATCEGQCSWADFTEEIFRLAGKKTRVERVTTREYTQKNPQAAPRPMYSVLDNYMLRLTDGYRFAPWQDAIAHYMGSI